MHTVAVSIWKKIRGKVGDALAQQCFDSAHVDHGSQQMNLVCAVAHELDIEVCDCVFQPCPFCFRIFLPATRARTARRNFSRSAGSSMSSLRFIASATVLA